MKGGGGAVRGEGGMGRLMGAGSFTISSLGDSVVIGAACSGGVCISC